MDFVSGTRGSHKSHPDRWWTPALADARALRLGSAAPVPPDSVVRCVLRAPLPGSAPRSPQRVARTASTPGIFRADSWRSGVIRKLLIETQTGKPAPGQMHAQFFHQLALAGDAVQI